MARTIRRQPFTVSTSSNDYAKPQMFNQVQFKGLSTNQNDITIDAQSFADVNNMLVDENGVLVSRPPVKFADGESNIIDERSFGLYRLRLYRLSETYEDISYSVFLLRCVSHNVIDESAEGRYPQYSWWVPSDKLNELETPKISYAQIEDKIFVWFAGIDFIALNTTGIMVNGEKSLYFEDGAKYLYTPIHKLIVNTLETELESKNLLSDNYITRYQYSSMSNVDFSRLNGSSVSVSLSNHEVSSHLYDIIIDETHPEASKEILIYPYMSVTNDVKLDIVTTPNADIILRYNTITHAISVSFGGEYFRPLPYLSEKYGEFVSVPQLTRDGMYVVVFTNNYMHTCKIAAQETADFTQLSELFIWNSIFMQRNTVEKVVAYFETIDNYVILIKENSTNFDEVNGVLNGSNWWLTSKFNGNKHGTPLFYRDDNYNWLFPLFRPEDELKVCCRTSDDTINIIILAPRFKSYDNIEHDAGLVELRWNVTGGEFENNNYSFNQSTSISCADWDLQLTANRLSVVGQLESGDIYYQFDKSSGSVWYISSTATSVSQEYRSTGFKLSSNTYITNLYVYDAQNITELPSGLGNTVLPLHVANGYNWYLIDGMIWTTKLMEDTILLLDILETAESKILQPPDYHAVMNTNYLAYETLDGEYLLEVTENRRDNGKLLLYIPQTNEQRFTGKITALHPLSDSQMGIFTEDGVWYISVNQNNDGLILYSQPVRSKLPVKLRDGDEVVTALDGQALIFPTSRGIVALAPQDFIATTEKTLSYLTDGIQEKYHRFYTDKVNTYLLSEMYRPEIKINTYSYWILFHKHLDREIFVLDTRSGSWWVWSVQYPILSITIDTRLNLLFQIDYNPKSSLPSLFGVSFVFADRELTDMDYRDDIVTNSIRGDYTTVHDNEYVDDRFIIHYASPMIDWRFTSQKLHFDQINNYKAVKAINMNLKGDDANAKLYTKVYRDVYHPEQDDIVEIKINELRTFVKRFNLMHVTNFQYRIENDREADTQHQFQLNSLGIKYEVKERIR